jgi:hypothetical protein
VSVSVDVVWMLATLVPLLTSHAWKFDEASSPGRPRMPMRSWPQPVAPSLEASSFGAMRTTPASSAASVVES